MKSLEELTWNTNVTSWVPADTYADLILEASVDYGKLSGVITAMEYDMGVGEGGVIQVRSVPARTAQGPFQYGETCLSSTSSTLETYSITVKKYGDYDKLTGYSLFEAKGNVKDAILNEMAKGLAKKRDQVIWTAISAVAKNVNLSLATDVVNSGDVMKSTYCCARKLDIYNQIVNAEKKLQGDGYEPNFVVMHPEVAKWMYYKDGQYEEGMHITWTADGQLATIDGMKVIETSNAASPVDTSGATMIVVLDSRRAVGEAWGKRPTFEEQRIPDCDYWKEVVWMYWGADAMDTGAIAHIRNP